MYFIVLRINVENGYSPLGIIQKPEPEFQMEQMGTTRKEPTGKALNQT
jgi:hypothetical protein